MSNIVLIGFMGCGKSTVARQLGRKTGHKVLDTDHLIAKRAGRSIPDIFAEEGNDFFRQLESETLQELQPIDNSIIATGGGIIEKQMNWPLLRQLGTIFFLDVVWQELQKRITAGKGRPLGGDGENWDPVRQLWTRRLPLYRQADEIINTERMSVDDIVNEILRRNNEG